MKAFLAQVGLSLEEAKTRIATRNELTGEGPGFQVCPRNVIVSSAGVYPIPESLYRAFGLEPGTYFEATF